MAEETKPEAVEPTQPAVVENKDLPDDGELTEDELDEVNGGTLNYVSSMLSNVSKTRSEISMTFARNSRG